MLKYSNKKTKCTYRSTPIMWGFHNTHDNRGSHLEFIDSVADVMISEDIFLHRNINLWLSTCVYNSPMESLLGSAQNIQLFKSIWVSRENYYCTLYTTAESRIAFSPHAIVSCEARVDERDEEI